MGVCARCDSTSFFVFPQNLPPRYDERLTGFGWNKVMHIELLKQRGYAFVVLPNSYVVHRPHAASLDLVAFRKGQSQSCVKEVAVAIRAEIRSGTGLVHEGERGDAHAPHDAGVPMPMVPSPLPGQPAAGAAEAQRINEAARKRADKSRRGKG